jgi:hypothetical protein
MTWGFMIWPPLATPAATRAICRGVACTSFWPIEAWARNTGAAATLSAGKCDVTAPGRSIGTSRSKPNARAISVRAGALASSTPIWANAELHDTSRMGNSVPPQLSPPKLLIGLPRPGAW